MFQALINSQSIIGTHPNPIYRRTLLLYFLISLKRMAIPAVVSYPPRYWEFGNPQ